MEVYPRVKARVQEGRATMPKEDASYVVRVIESLSLENHSPRVLVSAHANKGENGFHSPNARISKFSIKDPSMPIIAVSKAKSNTKSNEDKKTKNDECSKDNKCQNDSHLSRATNIESRSRSSLAPSTAPSKGKSDHGSDEDNKINIRASSVPRPRAVLSSPDNDEMIGNQNQWIREKQTPLKKSTLSTSYLSESDSTAGKNRLLREKRAVPKSETSSPKAAPRSKVSCSDKLERPRSAGKVSSNNGIVNGKRLTELSVSRQRLPPFKV